VAVIFGYGWFYSVRFPAMLRALDWLRRARPGWNRTATVVAVAAPVLYAWNFAAADGVATTFGWWSYVDTIGPTLHQAKGNFPLLYPLAFFAFFAVAAPVADRRP
jgi:hypothetical protein